MAYQRIKRRSFLLSGLLLPMVAHPALAGLEGRRQNDGKSHSSNVIRAVQGQLTTLGYDPKGIDGKIGPNTRAAIRRYQRDNDMTVTGRIDEALLISLGLIADPDG